MNAVLSNILDFQAALSGAAPANLATLPTAAPIETQEERRAKWLRQRQGKFTASEFHRLMGYPERDTLPKGAMTYAKEKAVELLADIEPDTYTSPAMQWGIDHEAEAVEAFKRRTGLSVQFDANRQEFIQIGEDIGGTPDGIISELSAGLEVKCPNSTTHLDYMGICDAETLKDIKPEYYWQIQGLMLILGFKHWFFVSYDPRFRNEKHRIHIATILRNDSDIEKLDNRLSLAIEYRNGIVEMCSSKK
jgi:hypothetical protein